MSEYTDHTLNRYLDQQPGMRKVLLTDPVQHALAEQLRQTMDAVEHALINEGVPEDVRHRVINRVIWGEPEGRVDVHTQKQEQAIAAYNSMPMLSPEALRDLIDGADPVSSEEKTP
jgi:hypothetical protein